MQQVKPGNIYICNINYKIIKYNVYSRESTCNCLAFPKISNVFLRMITANRCKFGSKSGRNAQEQYFPCLSGKTQ